MEFQIDNTKDHDTVLSIYNQAQDSYGWVLLNKHTKTVRVHGAVCTTHITDALNNAIVAGYISEAPVVFYTYDEAMSYQDGWYLVFDQYSPVSDVTATNLID